MRYNSSSVKLYSIEIYHRYDEPLSFDGSVDADDDEVEEVDKSVDEVSLILSDTRWIFCILAGDGIAMLGDFCGLVALVTAGDNGLDGRLATD